MIETARFRCAVPGCPWERHAPRDDLAEGVRASLDFDDHERTEHPAGAHMVITVQRHFSLRPRHDRRGKRARCACGWVGPLRTTEPTGRRRADALARYQLIRDDLTAHLREMDPDA